MRPVGLGRRGPVGRCGPRGHPLTGAITVWTMTDSEDVRRIALSLPETVEKIAWGMPTFRVAGKMFVTIPDDERRSRCAVPWSSARS